jgi:LmbE family N-acetylglucosaminyl deacetylase
MAGKYQLKELLEGGSWLVVSPHPDDDAIGLAIAMHRRPRDLHIAYATDGAPLQDYPIQKNKALPPYLDAQSYAKDRMSEAKAAMSMIGIPESRLNFLSFSDCQLSNHLYDALAELEAIVRDVKPSFVFTTPYESAHPDHDAASVLCEMLVRMGNIAPEACFEFASYNNHGGKSNLLEFATAGGGQDRQIIIDAEGEESSFKSRVLQTYASQQGGIISMFRTDREVIRPRPEGIVKGRKPVEVTYAEQFFGFNPDIIEESYKNMREFLE